MQEAIRLYKKYFSLVLFLLLIYLSFLILQPFLVSIISSIIFAYIFYPLYNLFNKLIKNKSIAALLIIVVVLLIIIIPSSLIAKKLIAESASFYSTVSSSDIIDTALSYLKKLKLNTYFEQSIKEGLSYIAKSASYGIASIPQKVIDIFIMFFVLYYLLKEGDTLVSRIKELFPIQDSYKESIIKEFNTTVSAILYGIVLVAVIQGALLSLGLYLFGFSSPLIWGLVGTIAAILPVVGTPFIWIPAGLHRIFVTGDIVTGIGIMVYGFFVSTIDNILKPLLISTKSRIHPVFIVVGIFAGLRFFGIMGIMIGPLILAIFMLFTKFYLEKEIK
jgi:predicted PurR-regulated permease PerM